VNFIVDENIWPPKQGDTPFKQTKKKKKAHGSEADLSTAIINKLNALESHSVICQKSHGTAYGKPTLDIFGSCNGKFFWLETKQPGEKPTPRQYNTMRTWIKKGAVASWTDSIQGAISFICRDWRELTEKEMLEGFHGN
jgi:hypothetical protein